MKNFYFTIIFALLCCVWSTKVFAFSVENADGVIIYYDYTSDGVGLEVTFNSNMTRSYSGRVVIPEEVTYNNRTRKVTGIGNFAFFGCNELIEVILPNSLTTIGNDAFSGCSLTSITIPHGVTTIGKTAFYGCNLKSINIPSNVTDIGLLAFSGTDATSIVVDDENPRYDSRNNCNGIIESASNTLIAGCVNTIIPNTVTSIKGAFCGCNELKSIYIPNSVKEIGDSAFEGCYSLTSITIPNSVTTIGYYAFNRCSGLTSIDIPNSVTVIGIAAFQACDGLTSVTIPASVRSIGSLAFQCEIDTVISLRENPFKIDGKTAYRPVFTKNTFLNGTLFVPAGTISKYKTTEGWKDFVYIEEIQADALLPICVENKGTKKYDLNGRPQTNSSKGINIIRFKDGTTKKVLVK